MIREKNEMPSEEKKTQCPKCGYVFKGSGNTSCPRCGAIINCVTSCSGNCLKCNLHK